MTASSIASSRRGRDAHAVGAEDLGRDARRAPRPASPAASSSAVQTIARQHRLERLEQPSTSLSAITPRTPTSGSNVNASCTASRGRRGAVRVVRGVEHTVGERRTTSSRPGDGDLGERRADHLEVEPAVGPLPPSERLDGGERAGGVVRLVRAVAAAGRSPRTSPPRPCSVISWPPTASVAVDDAELDALARDRRADLGGAARAAPRSLERSAGDDDRERARLDDPGLLDRRSRRVVSPR